MKLSLPIFALLLNAVAGQQLAFPGAEGLGRYAKGGRTGSVYKVTNLNDSGTGSLRDAVSQSNRIVVFTVGGVINISSRIVVKSGVYIAGQTAPGGPELTNSQGITVYGDGWSWSDANDSIVRYIRIRMGKGGTSGKDAITIASGARMIFDHVSVSWGRDETFSISGDAEDVTVQNSIIAQGLETHSCGGLMQTDGGISLFRNLYIDNKTRNPKVKGVNDFQNNDNFYDSNRNGALDGSALCEKDTCYSSIDFQASPYNYAAPSKLYTATEAVPVVLNSAGATFPSRDAVDAALVDQVRSYGTKGALISDEASVGGPGTISGGTSPTDTDGDGIPDAWESANGLNPNDKSDGMAIASNGYTNLENYVNSLVS
ncbi:unnamed protein product [Clonostachys chloroleuca]|uniref:Pectate lyase C n=1 Tax=Clonostachys chloroleuca TaxID=1926264 RepID=A0AA35M4X4_9HYPO|nr:unnamed protein product [Clonostachys chloroleuca]